MREKTIKVLLVEDDPEEVRLFEEVLAEIEESLYTRKWMQACEFVPVERTSEALEVLQDERFDVILLDTTLPDGHGLNAFLRLQALAPDVPIIVLAATDDEALAISLVRQGAQDYLIKSELDCTPLARSLRCAIERHRVRTALRSLAFIDDLTGLYTRTGFHDLAQRHYRMAQLTGNSVLLYLIELEGLEEIHDTFGGQERDLTLILLADILRDTFQETDVIARHSLNRFAVAAVATGKPSPDSVVDRLRSSMESSNGRRGGALSAVGACRDCERVRPEGGVLRATAGSSRGGVVRE